MGVGLMVGVRVGGITISINGLAARFSDTAINKKTKAKPMLRHPPSSFWRRIMKNGSPRDWNNMKSPRNSNTANVSVSAEVVQKRNESVLS